jgi:GNAT superfamily N-acetyltransferase
MPTLLVSVTPLSEHDVEDAGRALGAAFGSSPLERAVRGPIGDRERRGLIWAYTATLRLDGEVFVARLDGRIVGAIRWVASPRCRLRLREKVAMAPTAVASFGRSLPKAMRWVTAWEERDPSEPHVHLGPIGVTPELQGQGIGSRMLELFRERLDVASDAAYLETDKPENVRLYERFGFVVRAEAAVLGVPCWYMWRKPATHRAAT